VILSVREGARNCALRWPGKVRDGAALLGRVLLHAGFNSVDFQTCRLADPPKSAGREAALEGGLETCAAMVRLRDRTHNLSLSLVASCHR
jgi:hypothetical protein